jgi:hypothetical protein
MRRQLQALPAVEAPLLVRADAHLGWTIQPMLDHLRSQLGETNFQFLKALAEALSNAKAMPLLDQFSQWRNSATATSN